MALFGKEHGGAKARNILASFKDSQVMEKGTYLSCQMLNTADDYQAAPHFNGKEVGNVLYTNSQIDRIKESAQTYKDTKSGVNYLLFKADITTVKDPKSGQRAVIVNVPTKDEAKMAKHPVLPVEGVKLNKTLINNHNKLTDKGRAERDAARAASKDAPAKTAEAQAEAPEIE